MAKGIMNRAEFWGTTRLFQQRVALAITLSISTTLISPALAGPGDVNSVNNGQNVQGGTYFNTAGSRTTFQNPGGSLHVQSGVLVRGLESGSTGTPTGNGGTMYFRAPGNVIRIDGTVDVSAVRNGAAYTGNGGKALFDCAYMFHNGNIFANGVNGGLVQMNVGGITMGSNARTSAQGIGGNGGAVSVHSTGVVDFQSGSLIDTSGKVAGTVNTNIINIEGGAVNTQGVIRANGVAATDLKPDNGDAAVMAANPNLANNPVPPPISGGTGTGDTSMPNILFGTPSSADFRGGVIRIVATGQAPSSNTVINNANTTVISTTEKTQINNRNSQIISFNNGDVLQRGTVEANGDFGKNGGTVIISAARHAINGGSIRANGSTPPFGVFDANNNGANGGNGGTIVMTALGNITNTGNINVNGGNGSAARTMTLGTGNGQTANATITAVAGNGGEGGVIAFNYTNMSNSGSIQANGGVGGIGGHSNAFDTEFGNPGNPNPVAIANSVAGAGGTGGNGGLVLFSGNGNPTGGGTVLANGGQGGRGGNAWSDAQATSNFGTPSGISNATKGAGGNGGTAGAVISVTPGSFTTSQNFSAKAGGAGSSGVANARIITNTSGTVVSNTDSSPSDPGSALSGPDRAIIATRRNEYVRHQDVGVLLTQDSGDGAASDTLTGRMSNALIRTVGNPNGAAEDVQANAFSTSHLIIGNSAPLALTNNLVNSNLTPLFFNLSTLTISNNGNLTNNTFWTPGTQLVGEGFHDLNFNLGGGFISWLANGSITNNQIVTTRGLWSGGGINLAATQDVINNGDFITVALNKVLLSGFTIGGPKFESSHAGISSFKAGRDIINNNNSKIQSNQIFYDIHTPLAQNPPIAWPTFLNGAQIGATVNLLAQRNLSNAGLIEADALTFRNGLLGTENPALSIGGIVQGSANTGAFTNTGNITANGNAFFSPSESVNPRFATNTFAAATSFAGDINLP